MCFSMECSLRFLSTCSFCQSLKICETVERGWAEHLAWRFDLELAQLSLEPARLQTKSHVFRAGCARKFALVNFFRNLFNLEFLQTSSELCFSTNQLLLYVGLVGQQSKPQIYCDILKRKRTLTIDEFISVSTCFYAKSDTLMWELFQGTKS